MVQVQHAVMVDAELNAVLYHFKAQMTLLDNFVKLPVNDFVKLESGKWFLCLGITNISPL